MRMDINPRTIHSTGNREGYPQDLLAVFLVEADLALEGRRPEAAPPFLPPFFAGALFTALPRPEPLFLPPPVMALTVAQARFSASSSDMPRLM
jgi:hypothetical protein